MFDIYIVLASVVNIFKVLVPETMDDYVILDRIRSAVAQDTTITPRCPNPFTRANYPRVARHTH